MAITGHERPSQLARSPLFSFLLSYYCLFRRQDLAGLPSLGSGEPPASASQAAGSRRHTQQLFFLENQVPSATTDPGLVLSTGPAWDGHRGQGPDIPVGRLANRGPGKFPPDGTELAIQSYVTRPGKEVAFQRKKVSTRGAGEEGEHQRGRGRRHPATGSAERQQGSQGGHSQTRQ